MTDILYSYKGKDYILIGTLKSKESKTRKWVTNVIYFSSDGIEAYTRESVDFFSKFIISKNNKFEIGIGKANTGLKVGDDYTIIIIRKIKLFGLYLATKRKTVKSKHGNVKLCFNTSIEARNWVNKNMIYIDVKTGMIDLISVNKTIINKNK